MKRLAILALLLILTGSGTAEAAWPCWVVRSYAAARGLGPPLTADKEKRIKALVRENNISPEEQQRYAACFPPEAKHEQAQTPNAQGPTAQKHRRVRRAQRKVPAARRSK